MCRVFDDTSRLLVAADFEDGRLGHIGPLISLVELEMELAIQGEILVGRFLMLLGHAFVRLHLVLEFIGQILNYFNLIIFKIIFSK